METGDLNKSVSEDLQKSNFEPSEADSQPSSSVVEEDKLNGEISGTSDADVKNGDSLPFLAADMDGDLIGTSSALQARIEFNETVAVAGDGDLIGGSSALQASVELNETVDIAEDVNCFSTGIQTENGCVTVRDGSPITNRKRGGSPISNHERDDSSISGVKKARTTVDEQQPSVHVMYQCLTRDSKRKLDELLKKWSEWHAQQCSSHDSPEVLESGEETYFPALRVGLDKHLSVSFWMDNQKRNQNSTDFTALDSKSVPKYDRGYSLEGGPEIVDASRCFNCGSYGHSLKECPKPRDHKAVNNARKQHKSKRNQNPSSRNPTRYYQNSAGGKYDGLRPGVLDAETRKLLGLGELDPPPWLNRMREIGYPPGYLDAEYGDQPSGITIFGDEESNKQEKEDGGGEDGEILEPGSNPEPPKKMSVEFPGINAPIPDNADERRWAPSNSSRNWSHHRPNHSSEPVSRGQYHEQRWARDYRDEEGPPGVDPGFSSSYPPRYGNYDSTFSPNYSGGSMSISSPSFGRSSSDRGRRSPLVYEGSSNHGSHSSVPYSSSSILFSPPRSYGSAGYSNRDDDSRRDYDRNFSSHHKHHHHSRR